MGGCEVGTDKAIRTFSSKAALLPARRQPQPRQPREVQGVPSEVPADLLAQHPWLAAYVEPEPAQDDGPHPEEPEPTEDDQPPPLADPLDEALPVAPSDDALQEAWGRLREHRAEWEAFQPGAGSNFTIAIRGGAWTLTHKHRAFDSVVASARGQRAQKWGATYGMGKMVTFGLQRYTSEDAHRLGNEWCRKCEFFYNLFLLADDVSFCYTRAHLASYTATADWVAWVDSLQEGSWTHTRALEIQALLPRVG